MAHLFNEAGLIVITAFISPYRSDREAARSIIGNERMLEIFVDTPLAVCEARDPKGLYRKARAGEIANFTGLSAPYEAPLEPELRIDTTSVSPTDAAAMVVAQLRDRGFLPERAGT